MKFLVDMPLSPAVAVWLAKRGHEAVHAHQAGLGRAEDAAILRRAATEGEIIVTCDMDFPRLLALSEASGPPVILLRGGNYGEAEVLELLDRALRSVPEDDLRRSIIVVDQRRLRRTRLPLRPR